MTADRWEQIKRVYHQACEQATADREAFVREQCGADEELRGEVESLLGWSDRAGDMFSQPIAQVAPLFHDHQPDRVGVWRVLREIGRGGMGTVYLARRDDGLFEQQVAIKLLRMGAGLRDQQRFHAERKILASLDHPNIARILDGGTLTSGDPYLVMEYVEGEPLDVYYDRHNLKMDDRLRLFLQVCDAVRYAHRNLIVHRDLKPANILVATDGVPKLLDFGVARLIDESAADAATTTGLMLTPAYASPEQVRGEHAMVASDIYSLGVILYELLSGARPYNVRTVSPVAMARVICDTEPTPPSTVAGSEARKSIQGDLDNITMLAMRKDPERRYASVEAFAADIRNYLDGRPVSARRDSTVYRAGKFIRRNRLAVALGSLAVCGVIAGVSAAFWQARLAQQRAEDGHRLARSVLFEVYDSIARLPGATATKDLVAKRAVEYLDNLARQARGNLDLERDLANGYMRIAEVAGDAGDANLGRAGDAILNYRKAIDLLERIVAKDKSDIQTRNRLATAYVDLSHVVDSTDEQLALAQKALEVAKQPEQNSKWVVGSSEYAVAMALRRKGRTAEALDHYRAALAIYQNLAAKKPDDRASQRAVALVLKRMGAILWVDRRTAEAVGPYRQAVAIDEKLAEASPTDMRAKLDLSYDYSDLGNLLNTMGDSQGLQIMRRGLALRREAMAADPHDARARFGVVALLHRVAHVEHQSGDAASALANVKEAKDLVLQFGPRESLSGVALLDLAGVEEEWGEILVTQHACAEAQSHLDTAEKILRGMEARNALGEQRDALDRVRAHLRACGAAR